MTTCGCAPVLQSVRPGTSSLPTRRPVTVSCIIHYDYHHHHYQQTSTTSSPQPSIIIIIIISSIINLTLTPSPQGPAGPMGRRQQEEAEKESEGGTEGSDPPGGVSELMGQIWRDWWPVDLNFAPNLANRGGEIHDWQNPTDASPCQNQQIYMLIFRHPSEQKRTLGSWTSGPAICWCNHNGCCNQRTCSGPRRPSALPGSRRC
jgi:hypothetical protein